MKRLRIRREGKYYRDEWSYNETFGKLLDFACNLLKTKEIKMLRIGSSYQYVQYTGQLDIFWSKRKHMNDKSLVFKSNVFELESNPNSWDSITFTKDTLEIEAGHAGLYFHLKKPIIIEYQQQLEKIKEEEDGKEN